MTAGERLLQSPKEQHWHFCYEMLPRVSRTFALNIGELEGDIYRSVLVGYLLFRIADTFEDNLHRTEEEKIRDLGDFYQIFEEDADLLKRLSLYESLKRRWEEQTAEKELIEHGESVLICYFDLPEPYRKIIDPLIRKSVRGMIEFQRLKLQSGQKVFQLRSVRELKRYCYFVAGVVGEMLTEVFCTKETIQPLSPYLNRYRVSFGLALQLINVLKDYEKDLMRGWCYIPKEITDRYNAEIKELEKPGNPYEWKMVEREMSLLTLQHLDRALLYIKHLPYREYPLRMFCIIPFVLAYRTMLKILSGKDRKLTRQEVAEILNRCRDFAISDSELEEDYREAKKRIIQISSNDHGV